MPGAIDLFHWYLPHTFRKDSYLIAERQNMRCRIHMMHGSGLAKYVSFGITTQILILSFCGVLSVRNTLSIPFFASSGAEPQTTFVSS